MAVGRCRGSAPIDVCPVREGEEEEAAPHRSTEAAGLTAARSDTLSKESMVSAPAAIWGVVSGVSLRAAELDE